MTDLLLEKKIDDKKYVYGIQLSHAFFAHLVTEGINHGKNKFINKLLPSQKTVIHWQKLFGSL